MDNLKFRVSACLRRGLFVENSTRPVPPFSRLRFSGSFPKLINRDRPGATLSLPRNEFPILAARWTWPKFLIIQYTRVHPRYIYIYIYIYIYTYVCMYVGASARTRRTPCTPFTCNLPYRLPVSRICPIARQDYCPEFSSQNDRTRLRIQHRRCADASAWILRFSGEFEKELKRSM